MFEQHQQLLAHNPKLASLKDEQQAIKTQIAQTATLLKKQLEADGGFKGVKLYKTITNSNNLKQKI